MKSHRALYVDQNNNRNNKIHIIRWFLCAIGTHRHICRHILATKYLLNLNGNFGNQGDNISMLWHNLLILWLLIPFHLQYDNDDGGGG